MSEQAPKKLQPSAASASGGGGNGGGGLFDLIMLARVVNENKELADKIADRIEADPTLPRDPISLLKLLSDGGASASGGVGGGGGGGGEPDPDFVPFSELTSNKAVDALEKLYNGATYATEEWAHNPMMRMMARMKTPFDKEAAKELLSPLDRGQSVHVDYFQKQCIKVTMTPTGISTKGYNINHGEGRAKKVLG